MSQPPAGEYPFGRPSYIAPPYGPPDPQWGERGRRPRRGRRTPRSRLAHWRRRIRRPTVGGLAAVGALVLAAVGIGAALLLGHPRGVELAADKPSAPLSQASAALPSAASTSVADNGTRPEPLRPFLPRSTYTTVPRATLPPTGLGSDPVMNRLATRCYDGNMQACDDLFANSATNSLYEAYGDTCAGRQAWGRDVYCTTMFPGS